MGTTKVSNRPDSSRISSQSNYRIADFPGKKKGYKKIEKEIKIEDPLKEESLSYAYKPKKSAEEKAKTKKEREETVLQSQEDIKKALERIGSIKYYNS